MANVDLLGAVAQSRKAVCRSASGRAAGRHLPRWRLPARPPPPQTQEGRRGGGGGGGGGRSGSGSAGKRSGRGRGFSIVPPGPILALIPHVDRDDAAHSALRLTYGTAPPPGSGVLGSAVRSGPAHGTGLGGGHAGLEPPIQAWPAVKAAAPGHDWGGNRVQADVAIEAGVAAGRRGHPLQWGGRQRRHRYFQCLQVKDNLSYFLFYSSIISSCTYRPFSINDFFNLKETRSHLDA